MKQDIQKILGMNKTGRLTDEQAAELIAAVTTGREGVRIGHRQRRSHSHFMEPIFNLIEKTTGMAQGLGATNDVAGTFTGDLRENDVRMSRLESPVGSGYRFQNNSVRMSAVTGLRFKNAEVIDNTFDASRVEDLVVEDGAFAGCDVHMGSVEDVRIRDGRLLRVVFASAKCQGLEVVEESSLEDSRLHSGHAKHWRFAAGSHGRELEITGSQLNNLTVLASALEKVDVQSSQLAELTLEESRWSSVLLRGVRMRRTGFVRTTCDDVLFSAGEAWAWKRKLFEDVRFEDCSLARALFSECRFKNVVLRDVHLSDQKVQGVTLENVTLEGTAAFLQAVGLAASGERASTPS